MLSCNRILNAKVSDFVGETMKSCNLCSCTVSWHKDWDLLFSLWFNQVVCLDHFFLNEDRKMLHMMDTATRYSKIVVVDPSGTAKTISAFDLS